MVFSSAVFLFQFLVPFLGVYYLTPKRWRNLTLTLASYVFYGWWRPDFLLLILFSSLLDYGMGEGIARARRRGQRGTPFLVVSMMANLGLLGWFKYANFGIAQLNTLLDLAGEDPVTWTQVVLPVGISFYTFQTMSYTIDVWRGQVQPTRNLLDFLCFVSMFPQLVAGPVVRYKSVESDLHSRQHSVAAFAQGVLLFQIGLAKKLLIADVLKPVADNAFDVSLRTTPEAWAGLLAWALQIYFDFSGYSEMAIGLGLMIGFRFPINFALPYRARSITDFWRRWHITLSSWLRDYLYVALGGNRKGRTRTYANLMIVMLLGGLWHGDSWTFVAWGAWHGGLLAIERLLRDHRLARPLPTPLAIAWTFFLVCVGWVFFRAENLPGAWEFLLTLFGLAGGASGTPLVFPASAQVVMAVAVIVVWTCPTSQSLSAWPPWWLLIGMPLVSAMALVQLHAQGHVPFLYFRF